MGGSDQPAGVPGYALEGLKDLGDGGVRAWPSAGDRPWAKVESDLDSTVDGETERTVRLADELASD